jgi:hypothetical protein
MPSSDDEAPGDDDAPQNHEVDLDAIRSDLSSMQSSIEDHHALLKRGPKLREEHAIESEVDVDVPPAVADYVRAVIRETAAMTVEERNQFLYEELLGFELRTTRYHFPDGDVLEAGPREVVLRHDSEGEIEEL